MSENEMLDWLREKVLPGYERGASFGRQEDRQRNSKSAMAVRSALERVAELQAEVERLRGQLFDAHCLLQEAHAAIDPEAWPELSQRLADALDEDKCPPQCQHLLEAQQEVERLKAEAETYARHYQEVGKNWSEAEERADAAEGALSTVVRYIEGVPKDWRVERILRYCRRALRPEPKKEGGGE